MPFLDRLLLKNPIVRLLDRYGVKTFGFPVVTFARARMAERLAGKRPAKTSSNETAPTTRDDLLSQFLKAKENNPAFFHDGRVLVMAVSMAFAGSETTAISLAAVFYFLLRNRRCLDLLLKELDDAVTSGKLEARDDGLTSWSESQNLPYLDACVKESFRMHPAAGLPLERVTPPAGIEICGENIPGNTIVGCSAWVIHKRPEVFGDDVENYRPERWLEVSGEKRKEMDGTLFHFGAGARTCIGKNISLLEVYKLVPSFLRRFEVSIPIQEKEIILSSPLDPFHRPLAGMETTQCLVRKAAQFLYNVYTSISGTEVFSLKGSMHRVEFARVILT